MFSERLLGPGFTQNGWAQYSTGRLLPCLTMISCSETGAGVSVVCTGPASFDLANVAIDQTAVVATMTATTAKRMILRISSHPFSALQADDRFGTRSAVPRVKGLTQADFLSSREPRRAWAAGPFSRVALISRQRTES